MSSILTKVKEFARRNIFTGENAYDAEYEGDYDYIDGEAGDDDIWDDDGGDKGTRNLDAEQDTVRNTRRTARATRQAQNSKVLDMYRNDGGPEIKIAYPQNVSEAAGVCDSICDGKACVINLTGIERGMAQRIADFLGGAVYAVQGTIQRVDTHIFIIVPDGVRISGTTRADIEKDGYSFPKDGGRR